MTYGQFYRKVISHRTAVKVLCDIQRTLSENNSAYFYGYRQNAYKEIGGYDPSVFNMADEIRRMKAEVEEYRKLKEALKPILIK